MNKIIITEVDIPLDELDHIKYTESTYPLRGVTPSILSQEIYGKIELAFTSNGDMSKFINKEGKLKKNKLARHIMNAVWNYLGKEIEL